jgi:hypothetical protein
MTDNNDNAGAKPKDPKDEKIYLTRAANQKPFQRHDASYVCTVCKVKFFTKVEVEEHFMKHPLTGNAS